MEVSIALYEKAMPNDLDFETKFKIARECGYDRLEISIDETDEKLARLDWTKEEILKLANLAQKMEVPIKTMCLSGHRKYPLGSKDKGIRAESLKIMDKAIDFAYIAGINIIQLAGYDVYYEDSDEKTRALFEAGLRQSVSYAASKGIILAFETMETAFMDTVEKAMNYVNKINSPYLGVYPDIGNLKNSAVKYAHDVVNDLDKGSGHTFAMHVKETKPGLYRDMFFGDPTSHTEHERCLSWALTNGVRMFTTELWYLGNPEYKEDIKQANRFIRDKLSLALNNLKEEERC